MGKEGKFQGKTTKDDIIQAVLKTKRHVSCQRVPKKLPVLYSYTPFTPTFEYFYTDICYTCDILQLCMRTLATRYFSGYYFSQNIFLTILDLNWILLDIISHQPYFKPYFFHISHNISHKTYLCGDIFMATYCVLFLGGFGFLHF